MSRAGLLEKKNKAVHSVMNAPCHNCKDRVFNCHSSCQRYLEWQKKNQERLDAIERERVSDAVTIQRMFGKKGTWLERRKRGLKT